MVSKSQNRVSELGRRLVDAVANQSVDEVGRQELIESHLICQSDEFAFEL